MHTSTTTSVGTARDRWRRVLLGIVAAVTLVACGTTPAPPPAPAPAPTTTPAPPPDPLADAADGEDVTACQDGQCEVRIVDDLTVPVDPRYSIGEVRVELGAPGRVTLTAAFTRAGSFSSECPNEDDGCDGSISLGDDPETGLSTLTVDAGAGYRTILPSLIIDPVAITSDGVLLRLSHPTPTDGTDVGACGDGECAVQVAAAAEVPVDAGLGITLVRVEAVEADAVTVVLDPLDNPEVLIACGPDDSAEACPTTYTSGELRTRLLLGGQIRLPSVQVGVTAIDGPNAVLSLRPEDP